MATVFLLGKGPTCFACLGHNHLKSSCVRNNEDTRLFFWFPLQLSTAQLTSLESEFTNFEIQLHGKLLDDGQIFCLEQ